MNCTGRLHAAGGVGYKHAGVLLSLLPCSTAAPEVPSFTARCLPAGTPGALQHAAVGAAETMRSLSSQKHRISLGKPWCHASAAAQGGDEPRGRARCALRPSGEQERRLGPLRWGCWWNRAVFRAHQSVGEQVKGLPRRCLHQLHWGNGVLGASPRPGASGLCEGMRDDSSTGIPIPMRCGFKRALNTNGSNEV